MFLGNSLVVFKLTLLLMQSVATSATFDLFFVFSLGLMHLIAPNAQLNVYPIKCQYCPHIETSQLICMTNQLTGFYTRATLALNGLNE